MNYQLLSLSFCTQTRGRTGMDVTPLVFETSASTDSAIWATKSGNMYFLNCGAKVVKYFETTSISHKKSENNFHLTLFRTLSGHCSKNKGYLSINF